MIRRRIAVIQSATLLVIGLSSAPLAAQFVCEPFCPPPSYLIVGPDALLEGDTATAGDHAVQYRLVHTADDGTETLVDPGSWNVMDPDDVLRVGSSSYAFRAIDDEGAFLVEYASRTGVVYVRAGFVVDGGGVVLYKPVTVTRRQQKLIGLSIPYDVITTPALDPESVTQFEAVAEFRSGLPRTQTVQADEWWLEGAPPDAAVSSTGELTLGCMAGGWSLRARYSFEGVTRISPNLYPQVWPNPSMEPDWLFMTGYSDFQEDVLEGGTARADSLRLYRQGGFPLTSYYEAVPASAVQWTGSSNRGAVSPSGLISAEFYPPGVSPPTETIPVTAEYSECGRTVSRTFDVPVSPLSTPELRIFANGVAVPQSTSMPVSGAQSIELRAEAQLYDREGGGRITVPASWAFESSIEGPSLSDDGVLTTLSAQCDELVAVTATFRERSAMRGFHLLPSPNAVSSFTVSRSGAYEGEMLTGSIELAGPACDDVRIPLTVSVEPIVTPAGAPIEFSTSVLPLGGPQGRAVYIGRGERSASFDFVAWTTDQGMRDDIAVTRVMIEAAFANDSQVAEFALCSTSPTMLDVTAADGSDPQEVREGQAAQVLVKARGGTEYASSCGPLNIALGSSDPGAIGPTSVALTGAEASVSLEVRDISAPTEVGIIATLEGPSNLPASQPGNPQHTIHAVPAIELSSIRFSPSMAFEGTRTTLEVSLNTEASGRGISVRLVADDSSLLPGLPRSVVIPGGAREAAVALTVPAVTKTRSVTVEALLGDVTRSATVSIEPFATLTSLIAAVSPIIIGQAVDVTVSLDKVAPSGGLRIGLESSNPGLLPIDGFVTIPAGEKSAVVTLTAAAVRGMMGGVDVVLRAIQGRTTVELTVSVQARR